MPLVYYINTDFSALHYNNTAFLRFFDSNFNLKNAYYQLKYYKLKEKNSILSS